MKDYNYPWGDNVPPTELEPPPSGKPGGLKPPPYAGPGPHDHCPPPPPPPPIKPIGWIPGANWQEQMNAVMCRTNQCIDQWNYISRECYKALHDTVDAAMSNDVYYDRDEVKLYDGYDESEQSSYSVIAIRAVDKKGEPIRVRLGLAFNNNTNSGVTQRISDVSYITNANAIITAVSPTNEKWAGPAMQAGGAMPGETIPGGFVAGFNMHGVLRVFPSETEPHVLYQNKMVDVVGPVLPIIQEGAVTEAAQGMTAKKNICAIGWRRSDGTKFFFWSGAQNNTGMSGITVANILLGYDVTTAVVTAYEDAPAPDTYETANGSGMEYLATMPTAPLGWNVPSNSAFWYVTKRPFRGWKNRFEGEIADLVQKTGMTQNDVNYIGYRVETVVGLAEEAIDKANQANDRLDILEPRVDQLETDVDDLQNRMTQAETNITDLRADLEAEIQRATAAEQALDQKIEAETARATAEEQRLDQKIDAETARAEAEEERLQGEIDTTNDNLTQEIQDRTQADTNLSNAINAEALARETKDTELDNKIQAEANTRSLKDDDLQRQIDNIESGATVITINPGSLPVATTSTLGAIKVGQNLTITPDGVLNAAGGGGGAEYLPLAGGVMVGSIAMSSNKITNLGNGTEAQDAATYGQLQNVDTKVENILDGTTKLPPASLPVATADALGVVRIGSGLSITPEGVLSATGGGGGGGDFLPLAGGTMAGTINMNNNKITGLPNATDPTDAVTYDQLQLLEADLSGYLPLSGGTMTGVINAGNQQIKGVATPTEANDAVNLQYITDNIGTGPFLPLSGGTMTGVINVGGQQIKGVGTPTEATDAVNLQYITDNVGTGPFLPLAGGTMTAASTISWAAPGNGVLEATNANGVYARIRLNTQGSGIGVVNIDCGGSSLSRQYAFGTNGLNLGGRGLYDTSSVSAGQGPASGGNIQLGEDGSVNIRKTTTPYISCSGTTVNMNNNKVTNVADPTADTDAVNLRTLNASKGSQENPFVEGVIVPVYLGAEALTLQLPSKFWSENYYVGFFAESVNVHITPTDESGNSINFQSSTIAWNLANHTFTITPSGVAANIIFFVAVVQKG